MRNRQQFINSLLKTANWNPLVSTILICFILPNFAFSSQFIPVPVPKNIIYPGQTISRNMLRLRQVPQAYLATVNIITDIENLGGKIARTTLMPSLPIAINYVNEPNVISLNRPTIIHYYEGGLHISAEVIPLNNAKVGELVRARNIRSGIIISGIAQPGGSILIGRKQ